MQEQPRKFPDRRRWGLSSLTLRILAINLFAVGILFVSVLFLDRYQNILIESELDALNRQGQVFGRAVGEVAVVPDPFLHARLHEERSRKIIRRIGPALHTRARIFAADGGLIADSSLLTGPGGAVKMSVLPELQVQPTLQSFVNAMYERMMTWLPSRAGIPEYQELPAQRAHHYEEAVMALNGQQAWSVRADAEGGLVISVAVPVRKYRQIVGVLMLSREGDEIDEAMRDVRLEIFAVFLVTLAISVLLSLYLAGTITRPIVRLAHAAEQIRHQRSWREEIPDFTARRDEIGDLSRSLRDMTSALRARIDAIESFAADVAHEIKNPLTSLRSAVETVSRVEDPEQRQRLMDIIMDDVARVDRLITDISEASRLDAELSRDNHELVEISGMLRTLADVHDATGTGDSKPAVRWEIPENDPLVVEGSENRLVQVLRNLVSNAETFSPESGTVLVRAWSDFGRVNITVEDDGPGIPDGKLEAIFDRFYTERPTDEKFGTHSGLGLSISKQIIEAHDGTIRAENRQDPAGNRTGARFVISLPRSGEIRT